MTLLPSISPASRVMVGRELLLPAPIAMDPCAARKPLAVARALYVPAGAVRLNVPSRFAVTDVTSVFVASYRLTVTGLPARTCPVSVPFGRGVDVGEGVGVNVLVGVGLSVGVAVSVGVNDPVGVDVGVSVGVNDPVGVEVGVSVGVNDPVGVDVGVSVGVTDPVDVGVAVSVGVEEVGVAVSVGVGVSVTIVGVT